MVYFVFLAIIAGVMVIVGIQADLFVLSAISIFLCAICIFGVKTHSSTNKTVQSDVDANSEKLKELQTELERLKADEE